MKQTEDRGKCRCGGCGARFWRLSTFTRHRIGHYTDRRCMDAAAMQDVGFVLDAKGYWRPPPKLNPDGTIRVRVNPARQRRLDSLA